MTGATYPIDTLADMAAIPEDALPRFLAELPVMLAEIRRLRDIVQLANEAAGSEVFAPPVSAGATWIDDDARRFTSTVRVGPVAGEQGFQIERSGTFEVPAA